MSSRGRGRALGRPAPYTPTAAPEKNFQLPSIATVGLSLPDDGRQGSKKAVPQRRHAGKTSSPVARPPLSPTYRTDSNRSTPHRLVPIHGSVIQQAVPHHTSIQFTSPHGGPSSHSSPAPLPGVKAQSHLGRARRTAHPDSVTSSSSDSVTNGTQGLKTSVDGLDHYAVVGGSTSQQVPNESAVSADEAKEASDANAVKQKPTGKKGERNSSQAVKKPPQPKKTALSDLKAFERVMYGSLEDLPQIRSSLVRIFLSSTFSDFKAERNTLMKQSYPRLREFCQALGLDFQVVDLRWGISEDATNDHMVETLCLQEISHCQRLSRGPNFVAMLGDRYGFRPIPPQIPAAEFENLHKIAADLSLKGGEDLDTWYKRDDNADPPVYMLQPINSLLPHFASTDPEKVLKKRADTLDWGRISQSLAAVLRVCATEAVNRKLMKQKRQHQYHISVTEQEVTEGLLSVSDPQSACLIFTRALHGIEQDLNNTDSVVNKYTDMTTDESGNSIIAEENASLRSQLKQETLPKYLSESNRFDFTAEWQSDGINGTKHANHKEYLDKFCETLTNQLEMKIRDSHNRDKIEIAKECMVTYTSPLRKITSKPKKGKNQGKLLTQGDFGLSSNDFLRGKIAVGGMINQIESLEVSEFQTSVVDVTRLSLNNEVLHHLHLCQAKCKVFCGRKEQLSQVKQYLGGSDTEPLVIHAESGAGKTAFSAMLAKKAQDWSGEKTVVLLRFLGTSPQSSSLRPLLLSLCKQICAAYRIPPNLRKMTRTIILSRYFRELLLHVSILHGSSQPLVVLLDSLDQLSPADDAHLLSWLPLGFPKYVRMIVSVKSDSDNQEKNGLLSKLRTLLRNKATCFLELPASMDSVITEYISIQTAAEGRRLTNQQQALVTSHLRANPQPLLMKLVLNEACRWCSYTDVADLNLPAEPTEAITLLLSRLEKKYGEIFTSSALGYITASKGGISQVELEDALSCDNSALSDVYHFHNPPIEGVVRIPPLLWARTRHDLMDYISERSAQGKTTMFWYHRQFIEVATKRYLTEDNHRQCHRLLAGIFSADEPIIKSVTLEHRKLTIDDADRQVTLQPLVSSNQRALVCLPFHLQQAGDLDQLKTQCFCNLQFIQCYIEAFSLCDLLGELHETLKQMPDEELKLLYDCLRYSTTILQQEPSCLPGQLLGSLLKYTDNNRALEKLCTDCQNHLNSSENPALVPVLGSIPIASGSLKWYLNGPGGVAAVAEDCSQLLLQHNNSRGPSFQILNTDSLQLSSWLQVSTGKHGPSEIHNRTLPGGHKGAVQSGVKKSEGPFRCLLMENRAYMLFTNFIQVFSSSSGELMSRIPTDVNGGAHLHHQMAVSSDESRIVLAGAGRLAMLELNNKGQESSYTGKAAISLGGAIATTNLLFSHDPDMTLSSHTITAKGGAFGVVVLWNFWEKQLVMRVAVPAAVQRGFMYRLQPLANDHSIICGCDNGEILVLDMKAGKVSAKIGNTSEKSLTGSILLSSYDPISNCLLTGVKGQRSVRIYSMGTSSVEVMTSINTTHNLMSLCLVNSGKMAVVGDVAGNLLIYNVSSDGTLLSSIKSHDANVNNIIGENLDQIFTIGSDRVMKMWDLEDFADEVSDQTRGSQQEVVKEDCGKGPFLEDEDVIDSCVTADGEILATCSSSGVKLWKYTENQFIFSNSVLNESSKKIILSTEDTHLVAIFQHENKQKIAIFMLEDTNTEDSSPELTGLSDVVDVVSHENKIYILGISASEHSVYVYDLINKTSSKITLKEGLAADVSICAVMKEEFLIYQTPKRNEQMEIVSRTIYAVNLQSGKVQMCKSEETKQAAEISYVKKIDENILYVGCHGDVMTWKPNEEHCHLVNGSRPTWLRHSLCVHGGSVTDQGTVTVVTVSKDKTLVITGGDDGRIVLWESGSSEAQQAIHTPSVLKGHKGAVTALTISEDRPLFLSGSLDRSIMLWDIASRNRLSVIYVHMPMDCLQVASETSLVVAQGHDAQIKRVFAFRVTGH